MKRTLFGLSKSDRYKVNGDKKSLEKQTFNNSIDKWAYLQAKLVNIMQVSTWQGVPNIARSRSHIVRYIWICLFVLSFGYAVFNTIITLMSYLKYQTVIKYEKIQEFSSLVFPSVHICNLSPVDFSIKSNLDGFYKMVSANEPGRFYYTRGNKSMCSEIRYELITTNYPMYPLMFDYGFSLEKMLVNCYYNEQPCDIKKDFSVLRSPLFGRCYTFNFNGSHTVHRAGMNNGLQLELFLGESEYQPCWQNMRGAVVAIKNTRHAPVFQSDGLKVASGVETSFIITKVVWKKLGGQYSKCERNVNDVEDPQWIKHQIGLDGTYEQKRCIVRCAENKILQDNEIRCKVLNDSSFECNKNLQNQTLFYDYCAGYCPVPCDRSSFEVKNLGYAEYPSTSQADYLMRNSSFTSRFTYEPNSTLTYDRIKENFLKVNIYFSSAEVNYYEETPKTDFNELLATLGGGFDLFLGISVLSFFEAIDVIAACFEVFIIKVFTMTN